MYDNLIHMLRPALIAMALFAMIAGGLLAVSTWAVPRQQVFATAISFTFKGAEKGKYPNDVEFSVSDLLAPQVLSSVYAANDLAARGIDPAKFSSSLTVQPYSPIYDEVKRRFEDRLADRKITFVERQIIEKQMSSELGIEARRGAIITFFNASTPFDKAFGQKVTRDTAQEWARRAAEEVGAFEIVDFLPQNPIIDLDTLSRWQGPNAMIVLSQAVSALETAIRLGSDLPGFSTVFAADGQTTVRALKQNLKQFELMLLHSTGTAEREAYSEHRKTTFISARKTAEEAIGSIQTALQNYTNKDRLSDASDERQAGSSGTAPIDGDTISRVLELKDIADNEEFRRELISKQLDARNKASVAEAELLWLQETNALLNKDSAVRPTNSITAADAAKSINEINQKLREIATKFGMGLSSPAGSLYVEVPLAPTAAYAEYHPLINASIIAAFIGAIFGIGALVAGMTLGIQWLKTGSLEKPADSHPA